MGTRARVVSLLIAMTVVAFGVRRMGIDFGVPLWEEGDNHIPGHVELLRKGKGTRARVLDSIQYPSFLARIVSFLPPVAVDDPASATIEEHLAAARGTNVQVRTLIALLGVLAIPGTYLVARRFLAPGWSLFAAAILATSLLHLNFSQQSRPHAAFASLLLATTLASLWLRRSPTGPAYLTAGVAAALSAGCLHSGWMAVLPIAAAHLTREDGGGARRLLDPRLLLAGLPLALAIPVFYSFLFEGETMDSLGVFRVENGTVFLANHKLNTEMFDLHSGFLAIFGILWRWDPYFLFLLLLASAVWVATRRSAARVENRGDLRVLLLLVLPYLFLIGSYTRTFERFLLPVYPFLACFAAWGCARAAGALGGRARTVAGALLVLGLAVPGYASTRWAFVRSQPGTWELAGAWVLENVDPDGEKLVLTSPYDLPIARLDRGLRKEDGKLRTPLYGLWARYQNKLDESERPGPLYDIRWLVLTPGAGDLTDPERADAFVRSYAPAVFLVEVTSGARSSRFDAALRESLGRLGTKATRIAPDPDPYFTDHPLADEDEEVEDWPDVFPRILRAHACGPVIEVYRVP